MILGSISYLDCVVFLLLLVPQLVLQGHFFELFNSIFFSIKFLFVLLPYQFFVERYLTRKYQRSPFVQQASPFQDLVVRCVRHAFARFPPRIGRVFFSKNVALPFLRFRMLRHGLRSSQVSWNEVKISKGNTGGLWIIPFAKRKPDIVIYYCHGGGFSMGSSYFYLEFFLAWISLLQDVGYCNPAIFALEYSLVPDAVYPTQLEQTVAGYNYVCSIIDDPSQICVGGDSAGGTLILSLLLYISRTPYSGMPKPGYATLISPWPTLVSPQNRNTSSDYLNADSLHLYGCQYASSDANLQEPLVSPGVCKDVCWWARASPLAGFCILFGSEEIFGPEIRHLIALLRKSGCDVGIREEPGSIHAWPVAAMYLSSTNAERLKGLRDLTRMIKQSISR